jgi:hypothetical protein
VRALGTADRNAVSAVATKHRNFVAVEQYSKNVEQLDATVGRDHNRFPVPALAPLSSH